MFTTREETRLLTIEAWNLAGSLFCRFQGAGASTEEGGSPSGEEVWS